MKLQDLTLQQLKEIVDGAPEGATHYDLETQQYLKTMCDGAYRFTQFNTWSHMSMSATDFIKADFCTIDAISKEFEARKDIIANLSAESIENKGVEASDTISVNLDPKKCRIVDPALPYDEPFVNPSLSDEPWQNVGQKTQLDNEAALFNELPIDAELKAPAGQKHDQSKPRYSLIPADALAAIVGVLEYGATKYAPNNWKHVENARERYYNASMRHIQAWWSGEQNDPETSLPHLAHAACSLMFLMWLDGEQGE